MVRWTTFLCTEKYLCSSQLAYWVNIRCNFFQRFVSHALDLKHWKLCRFNTTWLYAECYAYRRLIQAVRLSPSLANFDMFRLQKEDAFFDRFKEIGQFLLQIFITIIFYSAACLLFGCLLNDKMIWLLRNRTLEKKTRKKYFPLSSNSHSGEINATFRSLLVHHKHFPRSHWNRFSFF